MGEFGVNIAGMFNAREVHGGEALTVYNVDQEVPDEAREKLEADERIIETKYISLNG
jgi:D-3-phosphoglycerate dehydrogenase